MAAAATDRAASVSNPLFKSEEPSVSPGEAEAHNIVRSEFAFLPDAMLMNGKNDIDDTLRTLRRRTLYFVIFVLLQALITLGVAVFAFVLMQEYGVKMDVMGNAFLRSNGKFGGLIQPSHENVHTGESVFHNLDLHSARPDTFFKNLDHVDMSFNEPVVTPVQDIPVNTTQATSDGDDNATRRSLHVFHPHMGHTQQPPRSIRIMAKVHGFARFACDDDCSSGHDVFLYTDAGVLQVRDGHVIPHLDAERHPGLDVAALTERRLAEMRPRHPTHGRKLQGLAKTAIGVGIAIAKNTHVTGLSKSSNHVDVTVGHTWDMAHNTVHIHASVGGDFNKQTHHVTFHHSFGFHFG